MAFDRHPPNGFSTNSFGTTCARNGVTKKPLKKNEQLKDRVEKDLAKTKRSPRRVRSFFRVRPLGLEPPVRIGKARSCSR